eukprot:scaffold12716_cov136-Isochrysis_galbana.AAC.3
MAVNVSASCEDSSLRAVAALWYSSVLTEIVSVASSRKIPVPARGLILSSAARVSWGGGASNGAAASAVEGGTPTVLSLPSAAALSGRFSSSAELAALSVDAAPSAGAGGPSGAGPVFL